MSHKTTLYPQHLAAGAKMIDFGGWEMPLHYGSQMEEHHIVRKEVGMFDVSHMGTVEVKGAQAKDFLRYLLCNDVAKLTTPGKALYSCMLNDKGGVIDDLIVYYLSDMHYRVIINAATREKDFAWMQAQGKRFGVELTLRTDMSMLAVQGPQARDKIHQLVPAEVRERLVNLSPFQSTFHQDWLIARTGYTGEDGYEIILPSADITKLWNELLQNGVKPCGLGARDTLRLEAGLNLYGTDMDENISPLEANLGWTVAWEPQEREFVGRIALENQKANGVKQRLVGVVLQERGVLRSHQKVRMNNSGDGEIISGTFSPTLEKAIGYARIPAGEVKDLQVDIRGKWLPLQVIKLPFVRQGKILV